MADIIVGTDSATYTPMVGDVGATLYCRVTATNAVGSASANSASVGPVGAATLYVGPGDIVSGAAGWWGVRAYAFDTIGDPCIRLVRASDSTEADFVTLADGKLDVASIATFLSATTGKVVTLYDQSGNGRDATQATDANRPTFVLGAKGTLPGLQGNGSSTGLATAAFANVNQPYTTNAVINRTGGFTAVSLYMGSGQADVHCYFNSVANEVTFYAGTAGVVAAAADSAWHVVQNIFDGASSEIYVDGATGATGNPGTTSWNLGVALMQTGSAGAQMTGFLGEAGIWPSAFDGTQKATMDANQQAYWGI